MVWAALVLVTIAVARLTRLVTTDVIMLPLRRWVVNKWGEDSAMAYLIHCSWCSSMWIAAPGAVLWAFLMLPTKDWWLAVPAALAMSYVTGLLSQLEER
jgi:hypothetical protein